MAEAAALHQLEQIPEEWLIFETVEPEPLVLSLQEQASDEIVRHRAAHFIGAVLTDKTIEQAPGSERPIESLFGAIHEAVAGDEEARKLVETCVATDFIERTYKTGHVSEKVPLFTTSEGKLVQYRQSLDSIQANSLRGAASDPLMLERTEAETRNSLRTEQLEREGWFDKGYSLLVISPAEDRPGTFFTETMSVSLQLTSKQEEQLSIEPAFVAGRASDDEPRHDLDTITQLGNNFGVDLSDKTPAEIIDTPILVHNSLIPNGIIDVVHLYDDAAGGLFFGERKPRQDYNQYLEECHVREAAFQPKVKALTSQLIAEAPHMKTKIEAIRRLDKLSGQHMVEHAMVDMSIDARVFGTQAAFDVEAARWYQQQGDLEKSQELVKSAMKNQTSFSCPSAITSSSSNSESQNEASSSKSEKPGDCEFVSKKCPVCGEKNAKTQVKNGKYYHVGRSCKA
jgi:hypothetical protein